MKFENSSAQNPETYKKVIEDAFTRHYQEGTDVWSLDDSLIAATQIALQAYRQGVGKNPHVLDIGCGNGRHCDHLEGMVASYTGVDLFTHENWPMIERSASFPVTFVQGDFIAWAQQEAQQYELILDNGCYHHQHPEEHGVYLEQIAKRLHPDGLLSVVVWGEMFLEGNVDGFGRYHFFFSPESIRERFESHSFEVLNVLESRALIGKRQLQVIARRQ